MGMLDKVLQMRVILSHLEIYCLFHKLASSETSPPPHPKPPRICAVLLRGAPSKWKEAPPCNRAQGLKSLYSLLSPPVKFHSYPTWFSTLRWLQITLTTNFNKPSAPGKPHKKPAYHQQTTSEWFESHLHSFPLSFNLEYDGWCFPQLEMFS